MDEQLAQDLATIWRSELTAMAADRELREAALALAMFWVDAAFAAVPAGDGPAGSAVAPQPARTAATTAASEPGADARRLERRVAELEQRLAGLTGERPGAT